jgi:hypothetical protein
MDHIGPPGALTRRAVAESIMRIAGDGVME